MMIELLMPGGTVERNAPSLNFVALIAGAGLLSFTHLLGEVDWGEVDWSDIFCRIKHFKRFVPKAHVVPRAIELMLAVLLGIAGGAYCSVIFSLLTDGATNELGKGSALLGTLATISFSYMRTMGVESADARKVRRCGEQFFHASLIAGATFILSAASTLIMAFKLKMHWPVSIAVIVISFRFMAAGIFTLAVYLGWNGFCSLNRMFLGLRLWRKGARDA